MRQVCPGGIEKVEKQVNEGKRPVKPYSTRIRGLMFFFLSKCRVVTQVKVANYGRCTGSYREKVRHRHRVQRLCMAWHGQMRGLAVGQWASGRMSRCGSTKCRKNDRI